MKRILLTICILTIGLFAFSQEGEKHKIAEIINVDKVLINVGSEIDIKIGDIFQVFGRGQVIHPATGKLIIRENVYLGKIEVIEVKELRSTAKILEKERQFAVGNKIIKIVSAEQEIIEEKKPIQGEFQNPNQRNYSETIYSNNKVKYISTMKISDIKEELDSCLFVVATKGGKKKIIRKNNKYIVFLPESDTSIITGREILANNNNIGTYIVKGYDKQITEGNLSFHLNKPNYDYLLSHNTLQFYKPIEFKIELNYLGGGSLYMFPKVGIIWYPNNSINKVKKYNNLFWIGGNLGHLSGSYPHIYGWYGSPEIKIKKITYELEIGFSPLYDKHSYNKRLFFGIEYKHTKHEEDGTLHYGSIGGSTEDAWLIYSFKLSNYLGVFCGYQFQRFAIELGIGSLLSEWESELYTKDIWGHTYNPGSDRWWGSGVGFSTTISFSL